MNVSIPNNKNLTKYDICKISNAFPTISRLKFQHLPEEACPPNHKLKSAHAFIFTIFLITYQPCYLLPYQPIHVHDDHIPTIPTHVDYRTKPCYQPHTNHLTKHIKKYWPPCQSHTNSQQPPFQPPTDHVSTANTKPCYQQHTDQFRKHMPSVSNFKLLPRGANILTTHQMFYPLSPAHVFLTILVI